MDIDFPEMASQLPIVGNAIDSKATLLSIEGLNLEFKVPSDEDHIGFLEGILGTEAGCGSVGEKIPMAGIGITDGGLTGGGTSTVGDIYGGGGVTTSDSASAGEDTPALEGGFFEDQILPEGYTIATLAVARGGSSDMMDEDILAAWGDSQPDVTGAGAAMIGASPPTVGGPYASVVNLAVGEGARQIAVAMGAHMEELDEATPCFRIRWVEGSTRLTFFKVDHDQEVVASPDLQQQANDIFLGSSNNWLIQQYKPVAGIRTSEPIFTVEHLGLGFKYVFLTRGGVTGWFHQSLVETPCLPVQNDLYAHGLLNISTGYLKMLKYLKGYHFSGGTTSTCHTLTDHTHSRMNILYMYNWSEHGIRNPGVRFTQHLLCSDALLEDVFLSFAGANVNDSWAFVEVGWTKLQDQILFLGLHTYAEARTRQTMVGDLRWDPNSITWLMPSVRCPHDFVHANLETTGITGYNTN